MSFARKMRKKESSKKYYSDIKSEATKIASKALDRVEERAYKNAVDVALAKTLVVACEVLLYDFGKLQKKESRLQAFVELMGEKLQLLDDEQPTETQLEVMRLLDEQCGVKIG